VPEYPRHVLRREQQFEGVVRVDDGELLEREAHVHVLLGLLRRVRTRDLAETQQEVAV